MGSGVSSSSVLISSSGGVHCVGGGRGVRARHFIPSQFYPSPYHRRILSPPATPRTSPLFVKFYPHIPICVPPLPTTSTPAPRHQDIASPRTFSAEHILIPFIV